LAYPRIGLSGDGGSTYLLPRLVGPRRAQDLEDRLMDAAERLASVPSRAYGATKRLFHRSRERSLEH
jgi:2-(1,2-epoxy-1,2-dihydrophenyl)acetyl-CoA isomerase